MIIKSKIKNSRRYSRDPDTTRSSGQNKNLQIKIQNFLKSIQDPPARNAFSKAYAGVRSTIHHPISGFTLIEIIVVVVIILTLTGVGLAGYNNFNQRQVLKQGALEVRSHLRDAQNRALAGEKTVAGGLCAGLTLDFWQVNFTQGGNSYSLYGSCNGMVFGTKTLALANNLIFSSVNPVSIIFKPIAQGGVSAEIIIRHTQTNKTITITVTPSGEITVGEIKP